MDDATSPPTGVDTLTVSEDLQKAGFTQPQANSLAHWVGKLVTKEDLRRVATHLNDKIGCVRKEMREKFEKVDEKFEKVYEKFDKVYEKFDKMHDKIDDSNKELHAKIDAKFDKLNDKIDKNVYILLGGMTVLIGIMTALLKLFP